MIATHLFWKSCWRLRQKSGYLFLALYLKQVRVVLQRFVAGDVPPATLSPAISLTRSGLPRIIPSFHRRKIREGDALTIRLYMSCLSVSKVIALAPKVGQRTFASIVTPSDLDSVQSQVSEMKPMMKALLSRYIPRLNSIPLYQGLEFVPTWKSVPSSAWYRKFLLKSGDEDGKPLRPLAKSSLFTCFFSELAAWASLVQNVHKSEHSFSQGCLWPPYIRYLFDPYNTNLTNLSLEWFERRIGPLLPTTEMLGIPPNMGRLCCSETGDGKRRLFAVGNYINQRLLYPLHNWLLKVLRRVPMDGTFHQIRPLMRLANASGTFYSIDLTAATDRWPLLLLFEIVQCLF